MGKHRQGGQSAQRFERLIEEAAHNFFKRATEHACSYWLPELENIQAINRRAWCYKGLRCKNEYFHHEITKKIAKTTFDVGYSNERVSENSSIMQAALWVKLNSMRKASCNRIPRGIGEIKSKSHLW